MNLLLTLNNELTKLNDLSESSEKLLEYISENKRIFQLLLCSGTENSFRRRLLELPSIHTAIVSRIDFSAYSKTESKYLKNAIIASRLQIILDWICNGCRESSKEIAKISKIITKNLTK